MNFRLFNRETGVFAYASCNQVLNNSATAGRWFVVDGAGAVHRGSELAVRPHPALDI